MHEYQRVIDVVEVPDPGKTLVDVDGEMIALFHVDGQWHAIDDVCTHDGGPLVEGALRGHSIACPRHGATFDIRSGAALTMPAIRPTRAHDVKVEDGGVWVRLREATHGQAPQVTDRSIEGGTRAVQEATATEPSPTAARPTDPAIPPSNGGTATQATAILEQPLSEDLVREMLRDVNDPELFVNIVDLGLVYGIALTTESDPAVDQCRQRVGIDMTMTSPACPAGPQLIADAKRAVGRHPAVSGVEVRIVMDPPWTPDRMTEAARDRLGIF